MVVVNVINMVYTGSTSDDFNALVNHLTGEINIPKETLPVQTDVFFPSPDNSKPDMLIGNKLSDLEMLEYFFEKYKLSVKNLIPNQRIANQLKTIIDIIQTNKLCEDSKVLITVRNHPYKKRFFISIGNEESNFLIRMFNKFFKNHI